MRLKAFLVVLMIAAACGGSDDPADDGAAATPPPSNPQDGQPQATPPPDDGSPSDDGVVQPDPVVPVDTTADADPIAGGDAPDLGDTSWLVEDYRSASAGITNTWIVDVTIAFSADGAVSGSAGCNTYEGTWAASGPYDDSEGQELVLEALAWTEIACEDDRVMTQEAEILDVLQNTGRWVHSEGKLNLRNAEGSFLADAVPTGRRIEVGAPCEGDPTTLELDVPVEGQVEMDGEWPEVFHFCVEIPGDVSALTVTLTGLTDDLALSVGYPDLETIQNGYAQWRSDERDANDELVIVDPGLADSLAPGSYYIEVTSYLLSDDPISSPFTLMATTG